VTKARLVGVQIIEEVASMMSASFSAGEQLAKCSVRAQMTLNVESKLVKDSQIGTINISIGMGRA
jgi:hypothetical protein